MLILCIGGNGSGKSEFAEKIAVETAKNGEIFYIAAMKPYGDEGRRKIERHKKLREGKNFGVVEKYTDVAELNFPKNSTVILECMSNLLANEMFEKENTINTANEKIKHDILCLDKKCKNLIVVSSLIYDEKKYDETTKKYIEHMADINNFIIKNADFVYEIVYGVSVCMKGRGK